MMLHRRMLALAALLLAGCQAGPQFDAAAAGPTFNLLALPTYAHLLGAPFEVASAPGAETPEAAHDAASHASLVVWADGGVIRCRLLDAHGQPQGDAQALSDAAHAASDPRVVFNPELGEYLVVYSQDSGTASGVDLFAQRVSNTGFAIGAPLPVSRSLGAQRHPAVTYDALQHQYFVVWDDDRAGAPAIYARRVLVSADHSLSLAPEQLVASDPQGHALSRPDVAFSPRGPIAVVCWQDARRGQLDILAQRLGVDGALKGPNYVLCDRDQDQRAPRLAYNPDRDRFVVVFEDDSTGQADTCILGRQLNGWGYPAAAEMVVASQPVPLARPHIAYNSATKSYLVTYDARFATGDRLGGRYLDGAADLADSVAVSPTQVASDAAVVADDAAFETFFQARDGARIAGQRLDAGF